MRLCDGCNVREPHEHRCHGVPCPCEECREADRLFGVSGETGGGLTAEVDQVLAEHTRPNHLSNLCLCGEWWTRGHQAEQVAGILTARLADANARLAAVWDEGVKCAGSYGHEDAWTHDLTPYTENPYRADLRPDPSPDSKKD